MQTFSLRKACIMASIEMLSMSPDNIVCTAVIRAHGRSGGLCGLAVLQDDGRDKLGAERAADYSPLLRPHAGLLLIP